MTTAIFLHNRAGFNPEVQTRGVTGSKPVFTDTTFTQTEQKLIRLGLDAAAQPGEIDVSAIKLFASLRRRGTTADEVIAANAQALWRRRQLDAARSYILRFGKYQGRAVGEVPEGYLRWVLRRCRNAFPNLKLAIEVVLDQGGKR
jgi:uncharacterized protein (DUF3820 family)